MIACGVSAYTDSWCLASVDERISQPLIEDAGTLWDRVRDWFQWLSQWQGLPEGFKAGVGPAGSKGAMHPPSGANAPSSGRRSLRCGPTSLLSRLSPTIPSDHATTER